MKIRLNESALEDIKKQIISRNNYMFTPYNEDKLDYFKLNSDNENYFAIVKTPKPESKIGVIPKSAFLGFKEFASTTFSDRTVKKPQIDTNKIRFLDDLQYDELLEIDNLIYITIMSGIYPTKLSNSDYQGD